MYYFIDKNQTQQGPFSIEELLLQNDFNSNAFVWTKGMKDWKPAFEINELKEFLEDIPPVTPDKANATSMQLPNAGSNGAAIAGFILAIATLIFCYIPILPLITGVLAFIFSIVGVCRKNRKYTGLGIAGTVISIIAIAGTLTIHAAYGFILKDAWEKKIEQYDDGDYDYDWD